MLDEIKIYRDEALLREGFLIGFYGDRTLLWDPNTCRTEDINVALVKLGSHRFSTAESRVRVPNVYTNLGS